MKKTVADILMIAVAMVALSGSAIAAGFQCGGCHAAPADILPAKHIKRNDFKGCFACHADGKKAGGLAAKVHASHLKDGKLTEKNCLACHPSEASGDMLLKESGKPVVKKGDLADMAKKMGDWVKSDKLVHVHARKGVSCSACHTDYGEDDPYSAKCSSCHGDYDALIPKTANTKQARNPHKSHYPTLKCTNCHQGHDAFKDFCKTCHGFNFQWQPKSR